MLGLIAVLAYIALGAILCAIDGRIRTGSFRVWWSGRY
jgi:hypothetical protein